MKILFDYDIFVRQRFGGISRYFYELINGLSCYKQITVNLFKGINNSGYDFSLIKDQINIIDQKFFGTDKLHFVFNIVNEINFKKYSKNFASDIFHKTYYSNVGLDIASKKVITIHDMTHELYPQYFAKSDNTSILKKKCIVESDGIVCVSETTKNDLINNFNLNNKIIKVIYHGVTIENNNKTRKYIKEPYILYVGQRWGYKNFNMLMAAYSLSEKIKNNFKLVCFGGGGFNYSEKLYIKEHNLTNNVIYLDGDDAVLASLYAFAEIFVYTSLYEGFGFPPLEAMKCGCPVLASAVGSVVEIVNEAAILFDPTDIEELNYKLNMLIDDSELRNEMINRGFERIKRFSWDNSVKEHIAFYKELNVS